MTVPAPWVGHTKLQQVYHSSIMFPDLNRSRPVLLTVLLVLSVLLFLSAPLAAKKKPALPEVFSTAQTVFVECKEGDITNLNLDRDQRDAILDLQDGVKDWGRYALARSRHSADLVFVVYKGRFVNNRPNGSPFPGTSRTQPNHVPLQDPSQADNSPLNGNGNPNDPSNRDPSSHEKDELRVYTLKPDGKFGALLWNYQLDGGLTAPNLQLLKLLKSQVEQAYPATPPNPLISAAAEPDRRDSHLARLEK